MKRFFPLCGLVIMMMLTAFSVKAAKFRITNGDVAAFNAALNIINANNKPDTIYLAYRGTYTFSTAMMPTTPFRGAIVIADDNFNAANKVVIYGNGSIIERDLNAENFRVISNLGRLELNDLYIRNGKVDLTSDGAGIANFSGTLLMNRCTLTDHSGSFSGGALYGGYGGYCKLVNCTITNCSSAYGSAIYFPAADADVINCTITRNTCWGNTGRVAVATGTVTLDPNSHVVITNTIIAGNKDGDGTYNDASGALRSGSGNLIGVIKDVNTVYFIFNDQTGTTANPIDAQLGTLGYYGGGLVPTIPLASTASPAFGKATAMFAPTLDQIGTNRVGAPSIGSMELTPVNFAFLKPKMQVLNNNSLLADGTGQLNFPNTVNGQQSGLENVVIKNNFNSVCLLRLQADPAIILSGAGADDFTVVADTLRKEFAPLSGNAFTAFQIKFTPKSLGQKTALVTIPSNDIDHPAYQFTVSGQSVNILPVELLAFTGTLTTNGNLLKWQTLSEQDNAVFEIWRSAGQNRSTLIGKVNGSGTTTTRKDYQFLDQNPPNGVNYYELKQIDNNGESKTYGPVAIKNSFQPLKLTVFASDKGVSVNLNTVKTGKALFEIYNPNGSRIFSKEMTVNEGQNQLLLEKWMEPGVYVLKVSGEMLSQPLKFIRQ